MPISYSKLFLMTALMMGMLFGCTSQKPQAPKAKVERKDLIQRVTVSGTVVPARQTSIQVSFEGYVKKVYVKMGDKVKKDQPLVTVVQSLVGGEVGFPIRAPYDGTVVQLLKKEGEYVPPNASSDGGNRLLRFDDLSKLYAEVNIPEIDVGKIKPGLPATLRASALLDQSFAGKVSEVSIASRDQDRWNRGQVEFATRIEITEADPRLKPGLTVMVDIIVDRKEKVLVLPHQYVQREDDKFIVTTLKGEKKEIQVGLRNDEVLEITGGLSEGDEVQQVDYVELMLKGA